MDDPTRPLRDAIDAESAEYMLTHYPELYKAVWATVDNGVDPAYIRMTTLMLVGPEREALALRCEATARHLKRSE